MSDVVPGMAPMAPSLPLTRQAKFLGLMCCNKARWVVLGGNVITACPQHGTMMNFEPLKVQDGT